MDHIEAIKLNAACWACGSNEVFITRFVQYGIGGLPSICDVHCKACEKSGELFGSLLTWADGPVIDGVEPIDDE